MSNPRKYDFQLKSGASGQAVRASGGMALVVAAGAFAKAAIIDATGAAAANPVPLTNGRISFITLTALVDIYVMTPTGHFLVLKNVGPGDRQEQVYNAASGETLIAIPFDAANYTATTETDTGIALPANLGILAQGAGVLVATGQSAKTVDVGLLASQSGGDADGFMKTMVLTNAGFIPAKNTVTTGSNQTFYASTTYGALLQNFVAGTDSTTATAGMANKLVYPTDGVAKNVSITTSSGTTTAQGTILLPALVTPSLLV